MRDENRIVHFSSVPDEYIANIADIAQVIIKFYVRDVMNFHVHVLWSRFQRRHSHDKKSIVLDTSACLIIFGMRAMC